MADPHPEAYFGWPLASADFINMPNPGCAMQTCKPADLAIGETANVATPMGTLTQAGRVYLLQGRNNQPLTAQHAANPVINRYDGTVAFGYYGWSLATGQIMSDRTRCASEIRSRTSSSASRGQAGFGSLPGARQLGLRARYTRASPIRGEEVRRAEPRRACTVQNDAECRRGGSYVTARRRAVRLLQLIGTANVFDVVELLAEVVLVCQLWHCSAQLVQSPGGVGRMTSGEPSYEHEQQWMQSSSPSPSQPATQERLAAATSATRM